MHDIKFRVFLPNDNLVKIVQQTVLILAIIGAGIAVLAAGTLALYALIWFCSVLTVFIHSLSAVFQTLSDAVHSNPLMALFFTAFVVVFSIKVMCWVFPSFSSKGARA